MASEILELPDLMLLSDYGHEFAPYLEACYKVFHDDFLNERFKFRGKRVAVKNLPYTDGRSATFYHITHEGKDETDRVPDLRRIERIAWFRFIMDNVDHPYLKVWINYRNNNARISILHEKEKYLVIVEDRGDYVLPWTAYVVNYKNKMRRLLEEYEEYISKL